MRHALLALFLLSLSATDVGAKTVKAIDLENGRQDDNTLSTPVLVASTPLEIGTFVQGFPEQHQLFRHKSGGVMGGKTKAGPGLDLGALFTDALRNEAPPMGYEIGPGGWKLGGTLDAIYYDVRSNGWAVFFYGTIVATLEIVSPEGETIRDSMQFFNYDPEFAKKPAHVLAEMLVEGAQELLARANVRHFHFPAHASVEQMMSTISAGSGAVSDHHLEVTAIGLSGSRDAVPGLLELLERTEKENDRYEILDALARLEDPRVIPVLEKRYEGEDEDVRWSTLRAMAYLGSDEGLQLVRDHGIDDDNKACRAMAEDALNAATLTQPTT